MRDLQFDPDLWSLSRTETRAGYTSSRGWSARGRERCGCCVVLSATAADVRACPWSVQVSQASRVCRSWRPVALEILLRDTATSRPLRVHQQDGGVPLARNSRQGARPASQPPHSLPMSSDFTTMVRAAGRRGSGGGRCAP